jgi:hypothetical protein
MVKVSDKDSCEPLVVIVKGESGLEEGLKASGTSLRCQPNHCDLKKNKAYVSKIHILVHVI